MRSQSLHARFRLAVLIISTVLTAVMAVGVYLSAKSHYVDAGEASARAIVAAVKETLAVGLYARDDVLLKELVEGMSRHPSVARVGVRDTGGRLLASEFAPGPAGKPAASGQAGTRPSFESLLMSPFNPRESVGTVQVWLDADRLSTEAGRQAGMVVGALVVLLGGVLVVFNALASRLLSRPMHRLARELSLITPGTARRLPIEPQHVSDEVGIVTAAANRLLDLQQVALERERKLRQEIAALEAQYRGIFDSTSAGIFILSDRGELLQANPALSRLRGIEGEPLAHADLADFAATVFVRPTQLTHLIEQARASSQPEAADLELVCDDGTTLWVHCMVSFTADTVTGQARIEGVLYDINQRKVQENVAHHRAEHDALTGLKSRAYIESSLGQQVNAARYGQGAVTLMFIDLDGFKAVNDQWGHAAGDAVLVEAARRLRGLFQRSCDLVGRLGGDELVVMIVGVEATNPSVAELAGRLIESFNSAFLLPNGETVRVGASVGVASYPLHATSARTLIHAADAAMYAVKQSGKGRFVIAETGIEWAEDEPAEWQDAFHALVSTSNLQRDPLTGLMDRRQLVDQLTSEQMRVAGGAGPAGVICLDVDRFKLINVAHGAQIGDEVLCELARRLGSVLRRNDILARTGSDEFVVLVPGDTGFGDDPRHMAESVAGKLLESLAQPFVLGRGTLTIHASAGVSVIGPATTEGQDALREAQLALRRAKLLGGGRQVFFEENMMADLHGRLALEADLRAAIGSDQFFLHVQPQVDRDGTVTGGEALLRWQHPERGNVPPDQFIPLAEACGAMVELGAWVLRAGCAVLVDMRRQGGEQTLAVNISPVQFNHPDFVQDVQAALSLTGAPAEGLILEITEGLLITDIQKVTERLHELVALGVRFSIDDFGTGFSSLAYLRQLPLHEIKIDRSFIAGLPHDVAGAGIVCSILSMGQHLGLHVVAEGVETREQSAFLVANGCPSRQGWLHGRPMPSEKFLSLAGGPALLAGPAPDAGS
ncbi:diguanylate cyclase [Xylophilus sp. Kf1]|nr:diguanylate cyclase [Xylophilus sp. Kf1]